MVIKERGGISSTALRLRERLSRKGMPPDGEARESIPAMIDKDEALIELYRRSIQAADLPYEQRVDMFWEGIKDSVDDITLGVGFLIRQLPLTTTTTQTTTERDITRKSVREILKDRIHGISNGLTTNDKFELELNLLAILTYIHVEGKYEIPKEARHYLSSTVGQRSQEEQLLMIITASNYEHNTRPKFSKEQTAALLELTSLYERGANGDRREKVTPAVAAQIRPKSALTAQEFDEHKQTNHKRLTEIVNRFVKSVAGGTAFDGKTLRMAGILLTANENLIAFGQQGMTTTPLRDLAVAHIVNFYRHFQDADPALAINAIAEGLEDQPIVIKRIISALLVDRKIMYENPMFGGVINRNLSPLLRNLLARIGENSTPEETNALISLINGLSYQTFLESGEKYAGNLLVEEAFRSDDAYTASEKKLLLRWYLHSLLRYGFVVDVDSLSEDELSAHGKGEWYLLFKLTEEGQIEDGTDIVNHLTGKVVGYYESPQRTRQRRINGYHNNTHNAGETIHPSTNGHVPEADISEVVVFQEQAALPGESPSTDIPQLPQNDGDPLHIGDIDYEQVILTPEPRLPAEEESVEELLSKIFKTVSADELRAKTRSLWSDLDPYGPDCKRRSTISREGTPLKLDLTHRVRADDHHYPRVVIARREEKDEDGVSSSDIGGTFYFSEGLVYPFFLDGGGGLQGPLADLFLEGKTSHKTYLQLNYVGVSFAHSLAVADKSRLETLEKEAYMQVKRETEGRASASGKKRETSQERIARLVDESKKYVKMREKVGTGGHMITESYIDRELVEATLKPGEAKRVYRFLTLDEMDEGVKKARKGKAKPNAENGRAVVLPYGKKAKRTAIKNALDNHIRLFAVEVSSRNFLGVIMPTISLESTFSAYPDDKNA